MATRGMQTGKGVEVKLGLGDIASRIDDTHLVLWSRNLHARERVADDVIARLHTLSEGRVVTLPGAKIHDLASLRRELDRELPSLEGKTLKPSIEGPAGLLARIREEPQTLPDGHHVKWRYYVWRDADVLLRSSPAAFSVMVDAVAGIAAEAEFSSPDLLLIHRLVLIGGPALQSCYGDERGPLRQWRPGSPWARQTRVDAPRFLCWEIPRD